MVGAVSDFVKKKQPKSVTSVRMVIFQSGMLSDFHSSMVKVQGEPVKKSFLNTIKGSARGWDFILSLITQSLNLVSSFSIFFRNWGGETFPGALGSSGGAV